MNIDEVATEQYMVIYLDMLGTTSKIKSDAENRSLQNLYHIYNSAINTCIELYKAAKEDLPHIKIFSDNLIIATPLSQLDSPEKIRNLLYFTSTLQHLALTDCRWLMRGGITIGELFINDIMVWGKGLISAHDLEERYAIYPRILIDASVIRLTEGMDGFLDSRHKRSPLFKADRDNRYYLNYLKMHNPDGKNLKKYKRCFNQLLEEFTIDGVLVIPDGIKLKLIWHKNYLNSYFKACHRPGYSVEM